jgi:hypothetical protein
MKFSVTPIGLAIASAGLLTLAGCGGGGGSASAGGSSSSLLGGLVASGAIVPNAPGYILDAATGTKTDFGTDSTGRYSVSLAGQSGPFLIRVFGTSSTGAPLDMYSIASTTNFGGTINVTPLTNVILGYAGGGLTSGLETSCTATIASCPTLLNTILANLTSANTTVFNNIPGTVLGTGGQFVIPAGFNAFTTPFTANHTGIDGFMDVLQVVPPAAAGASTYQLNLVGPTPTALTTLPTSGTAGTQSVTVPTKSANPSAPLLAQAANLAKIQGEVDTFFSNFKNLFATALPLSTAVDPYLDASFKLNGMNKAAFSAAAAAGNVMPIANPLGGGSLAPYSGAPGVSAGTSFVPTTIANVTYDGNNCVTSLWTTITKAGSREAMVKMIDTGMGAGCTGGTWTLAGNQRNYSALIEPRYSKSFTYTGNTAGATAYAVTLKLGTESQQTTGYATANAGGSTKYGSVKITGPGFATRGSPNATSGSVILVAQTTPPGGALQESNSIKDAYYGTAVTGSHNLRTCAYVTNNTAGYAAATNATPCMNSSAVGGGDYEITFYSGYDGATGPLETVYQRLASSPDTAAVPTTWYPTITSSTITAANLGSFVLNSTTPTTTTWTLPSGSVTYYHTINMLDSGGALVFSKLNELSPTVRTDTMSVVIPNSGNSPYRGAIMVGSIVGGLKVEAYVGRQP